MKTLRGCSTLLLGCLAALTTLLSAVQAKAAPSRVDPQVIQALRTGIVGSSVASSAAIQRHQLPLRIPTTTPAIVELNGPANDAIIKQLVASGALVHEINGKPLYYNRFVPVQVSDASIRSLLRFSHVKRISAPIAPPIVQPMDHSAKLIELAAARGARPAKDTLLGDGVVVADLDSNADIFHPMFFRADAGWYDWIDVNGDGVFTVGKDAIDLNRDGVASLQELAELVLAATCEYYGDPVKARSPEFDPATDWVYIDTNSTGKREYGSLAGFDDTVPALGEPLFVPDDVNRNGVIEPQERFARLGTSKFKKVYARVSGYWGVEIERLFERGKDMSEHMAEFPELEGQDTAAHGSSILSIIAGDVPLIGRKWVGVAPNVDLLLGFVYHSSDATAGVTWVLQEKPDAVLHETANWAGTVLDGSDPYSQMVDTSIKEDKVTHTCPMGNLGESYKHAFAIIPAKSTQTHNWFIPAAGFYGSHFQYAEVSLNYQGGSNLSVELMLPDGSRIDASSDSSGYLPNRNGVYLITRSTSPRSTEFVDIILYNSLGKLPTGTYSVITTNSNATEIKLDGYLIDELSGWNEGVAWDKTIATDASTVGIPATSDFCISVGAHTGHPLTYLEPWYRYPGEPKTIRYYSGRGPRIDGAQRPDIAAPDNPWSAAPATRAYMGGPTRPHGAVTVSGGTSGATPHVTGVTAMLAQVGIRGLDAQQLLRDSAFKDEITGAVPNFDYGWGRLNAAGALGAEPEGLPPTLTAVIKPDRVVEKTPCTIEVTASDPDGDKNKLQLKWDDGYDGSWDIDYGPVQSRTITYDKPGIYRVKVRLRDEQGLIDEVALRIVVEEGHVIPDDAGPDSQEDTGGDVDTEADVLADTIDTDTTLDSPENDSSRPDAPELDSTWPDASPKPDTAQTDTKDDATSDVLDAEDNFEGGGCGCRINVAEPSQSRNSRSQGAFRVLVSLFAAMAIARRRRIGQSASKRS